MHLIFLKLKKYPKLFINSEIFTTKYFVNCCVRMFCKCDSSLFKLITYTHTHIQNWNISCVYYHTIFYTRQLLFYLNISDYILGILTFKHFHCFKPQSFSNQLLVLICLHLFLKRQGWNCIFLYYELLLSAFWN